MEQTNGKIVICAIVCLTILEALALFKGVNGVLLTTIMVLIAGLAGFVLPSPIKLK